MAVTAGTSACGTAPETIDGGRDALAIVDDVGPPGQDAWVWPDSAIVNDAGPPRFDAQPEDAPPRDATGVDDGAPPAAADGSSGSSRDGA